MWPGGSVGLKSILNAKSRAEALGIMDKLVALGYICYEPDEKTKKLTYCIKDWAIECNGKKCMNGVVYTTDEGWIRLSVSLEYFHDVGDKDAIIAEEVLKHPELVDMVERSADEEKMSL